MTRGDPPQTPTRIGPYVVEGHLGSGGMGEVWLGRHRRSGRRVAVKVLGWESDSEVLRFRREIESCAKIRHPNVVRIFSWGSHEDMVFYAMEFLDAPDLLRRIHADGPLDELRLRALAAGLARGLEAIHDAGMLHRDLKPANVVVLDDDRTVITDFGLVKDLGRTSLTATGALVGTPRYLPPEIWKGARPNPAGDVYQAGLVLLEAMIGRQAFPGNTVEEVSAACLAGRWPSPAGERPDLPAALHAWVDACLHLDPDARPRDGRALRRLVDPVDPNRSQRRRPAARNGEARRPPAIPRADAPSEEPAARRPSPMALFVRLLPLSLLLLAGSAALWVLLTPIVTRSPARPVSELRLRTGFETARITWRSDSPFPSTIRLETAGVPGVRLVQGTGGRDHVVDIGDLRPGARHRIAVVLPDGRIGATRDLVIPAPKLELRGIRRSASSLIVEWRSSPAVRALLRARVAGRWVESPPSPEAEEGTSMVPRSTKRLEAAELRIVSPLGETRTFDVAALAAEAMKRGLRGLALPPERAFDAFSLDATLQADAAARAFDLPEESPLTDAQSRKRREGLRALFVEEIRKRGLLELEDELRGLVPFVLETRLLPLDLRSRFYEALCNLRTLHMMDVDQNLESGLPWRTCLGPYGTTRRSHLRSPRSVRIRLESTLELQSFSPFDERPDHAEWSFTLSDLERVERAEVALGLAWVKRMPKIVLTVNGRHGIHVFPPFGTERDAVLHSAIVPDFLVEGRNTIRLRIMQMPLSYTLRGIGLNWIALRVEP